MPEKLLFNTIVADKTSPVVVLNNDMHFVRSNRAFRRIYGWRQKDLVKKEVTEIIPKLMQFAHKIAYDRFLKGRKTSLAFEHDDWSIICRDGHEQHARHEIAGVKKKGKWQFAARITPVD